MKNIVMSPKKDETADVNSDYYYIFVFIITLITF